MAPRLIVDSVLLVTLTLQFLPDRPRCRPYRRILNRHFVFERILVDTRIPFDELPVLTRLTVGKLGRKVRSLDNQRVTFPGTTRVPMSQTNRARRMAPAQVDDTLEPLPLPSVIPDSDRILALYDAAEPIEIWCGTKHAPIAQTLVLRAVVPVHAQRVVEGGDIRSTRRWWPELPAFAGGRALLAGRGVPHEHDTPLAPDLVVLLSLWG